MTPLRQKLIDEIPVHQPRVSIRDRIVRPKAATRSLSHRFVTISGRVLSTMARSSFCSRLGTFKLSSEAFRSPMAASNSGFEICRLAWTGSICFPVYLAGPPVASAKNSVKCFFNSAIFWGVGFQVSDWPRWIELAGIHEHYSPTRRMEIARRR
jgi:hypothetical protein